MKVKYSNIVFFIALLLTQISLINPSLLKNNNQTLENVNSFLEISTEITLKEDQSFTPFFNNTIVQGVCSSYNCMEPNGQCIDEYSCECQPGYSDINKFYTNEKIQRCSYKLKKQFIAFLLEFFLIIGIGHFYSSRYLYGALKAAAFIFVILFDFCLRAKQKQPRTRVISIVVYVLYFLLLIWHTFDIVMFGINKFRDGNDLPLYTES